MQFMAKHLTALLGAIAILATAAAAEKRLPPSAPTKTDWVTRVISAPRVSHHVFPSRHANAPVSYHLFTPSSYEQDNRHRLPVLYWLHGSGGGLAGIPQLAGVFNEAIESGRLPPCLVVLVNGLPDGMYVDWKDGAVKVESVIIHDLIPHIDASHRTIADRSGRVIEGFSMGGYGAARLGFSHPHLFAGVSLLGAGPMQPDFRRAPRAGPKQREEIFRRVYGGDAGFFLEKSPWKIAELQRQHLKDIVIRQAIGDRDETFENNRAFHERMTSLGIAHTWTVVPAVGHDPMRLIRAMGDDFWAFHRAALARTAGTARD